MHSPFLAPPPARKKEKEAQQSVNPVAVPSAAFEKELAKYQEPFEWWENRRKNEVTYGTLPTLTTTTGSVAGLAYTVSPTTASSSYTANTVKF